MSGMLSLDNLFPWPNFSHYLFWDFGPVGFINWTNLQKRKPTSEIRQSTTKKTRDVPPYYTTCINIIFPLSTQPQPLCLLIDFSPHK